MPGITSSERFTPNTDKKDSKISDVRTRNEKTVELLQEDKKVRKEVKGADKSFAERRGASGRFEAVAGLEDDLQKAQENILQEVVEKLKDDTVEDLERLIDDAVTRTDVKALPLSVKEQLTKKAKKVKNLLKRKDAAYEKLARAEEGSDEEAIYGKMLEKYIGEIDKLTGTAA